MILLFCLFSLWSLVSSCSEYSDCLQCELDFKCTFKEQCEALIEPTASPFSIHKAGNCYLNHNLGEEMENLCLKSENEGETVFQALPSSSPSFCYFPFEMESTEEYELNLSLEGSSDYFLEVITNDKTDNPLVLNRGTFEDKTISVAEANSLKIYVYSASYSSKIEISVYPEKSSSMSGIMIFVWVVVGTVVTALLLLLMFSAIGIIVLYYYFPAPQRSSRRNRPRTCILGQNLFLKEIENKINEKEEQCSICLELIKVGDNIGDIKCTHLFHYRCIGKWILDEKKNKCPYCNQIMFEDKPLPVQQDNPAEEPI